MQKVTFVFTTLCAVASAASFLQTERDVVEEIDGISACAEVGSDVIRQPKRAEDIHEILRRLPCDVRFSYQHGDVRRHSVFAPHLQNVGNEIGFVVQAAPLGFAGLERIMLKGKEGEISEAPAFF